MEPLVLFPFLMNSGKRTAKERLIDQLPVVVFEYTFYPNGHRDFTYISPRCEELLGIDPETVMHGNLTMTDFIHPDDRLSFNESVELSLGQLQEWSWEGRCKGNTGFIWVEAQGMPLKMKDGRIIYSGVFSDITEKKGLEQRYQELIDQLPLGIAIHAKGKIIFVNPSAARMIGAKDPDELIGLEIRQFLHPDSLNVAMARVKSVINGVPAPPIEEKYIRLDGSIMDAEVTGYPYQYNGEPAVQVIFTDITDKKKAEASFRKTETLLDQLFQNAPLAVTLLNEDGNVVQINRGFEETFGFTLEELQGKGLNQFIVPSDLVTEGNDLNTLISRNRVIRTETVRHRKDGKVLSVIIYGVPVLLQDQTLGIFGMYVDITERRKVEEELKIRNIELDNFVYKVSHDLRAPLSSVLGLAHLASLPGNNDNLAEYVKLMGKKAGQLDHFISDVLSHSKNLKMELKIEKINFREILNQTFDDLSYLTGVQNIIREVNISAGEFYSDPWRIAEIFRNLVSNAVKYRKLGNTEAIITVNIEIDRKQCFIEFLDNGIGIDRVNLEKVFEMFYRASDQSEGSGLGLYIVKNAVEKLGGKVSVESDLGLGTTFKIALPDQRLSK
jgi:PAS domain S-box-containing protein